MFAFIKETFDWIANLSIIVITLYGFYRAFIDKRISVIGISNNHGKNGSNKIITLKNHALREIYLEEAYIIYDNQYALHLVKWDKAPCIIAPNGVIKFETEHYSYLKVSDETKLWEPNAHVFLRTPEDDIIHARFKRNHKIKKRAEVAKVPIMREYYNGMLIHKDCKYVLRYKRKDDEEKMLQIYSSGVMSDALIEFDETTKKYRWFNGVPNIVDNPQELVQLFEKVFSPYEMDFIVLVGANSTFDDPKSDFHELEKTVYKKLRSTNFSYESDGVRREVTT